MLKTMRDPALQARQDAQAERLERLRRALGITQTAAAKIAGVSIFKWHRMEGGLHPIDPLALQIFCDAHSIGADYVITAKLAALTTDKYPDLLREVARLEMLDAEQHTHRAPPRQASQAPEPQPATPPQAPHLYEKPAAAPDQQHRQSRKRRKTQTLLGVLA